MTPETALAEFDAAIASAKPIAIGNVVPPILFICGAPRSGTTMVYQALAHGGQMGCVTNLIARFIANPALGVRLAQALDIPSHYSGKSDFGRTAGWTEPHEFGRGWLRILGVEGLAEPKTSRPLRAGAAEELAAFAAAWEKPVVFKSFAYLWFIQQIASALPTSIWLHIKRDPVANAASLARLYQARGSAEKSMTWESAVCQSTISAASGKNLAERCLAQVTDVDAHIARATSELPSTRRLTVQFEDFVAAPRRMTQQILDHFILPTNVSQLSEIPA